MHPNEQLLTMFYTAFQNRDYRTMQQCYSDGAVFNDAVFKNLNAAETRAMWEMLIKRGKDLRIDFGNVTANEHAGSADWTAHYTFSASGRLVKNVVSATFEFENGKISRHTDSFDFYRWSRQALGMRGLLLGWTPFLRQKVQNTARKSLDKFINAAS
jgi:limonene-1,2-epoxide hydrolase